VSEKRNGNLISQSSLFTEEKERAKKGEFSIMKKTSENVIQFANIFQCEEEQQSTGEKVKL
jgi:hypothetical protein